MKHNIKNTLEKRKAKKKKKISGYYIANNKIKVLYEEDRQRAF